MKRFNTTGTCFPQMHYMVDISERVEQIKGMVDQGDYFCINRGRQYGKTTTLQAIKNRLSGQYDVIFISFEGLGDSACATDESLAYAFVDQLLFKLIWEKGINKDILSVLQEAKEHNTSGTISLPDLSMLISRICSISEKPVLLMVDEVDQSSNFSSFIHFLGMLRKKYLERFSVPTFHSVILAGVYDIKNLKLKMRPEGEHQYNSPWNIAVPFDIDMSLHADGIAGMLAEYKSDHGLDFDENFVAGMIYDYTRGYPFMVSRLCQIIDQKGYGWDYQGVLSSVHDLLNEQNTLFDDMVKKMDDFPELKELIMIILCTDRTVCYSPDEKYRQMGLRFCYLRNTDDRVYIANKIFEYRLCSLFAEKKQSVSTFCLECEKKKGSSDFHCEYLSGERK